VDKDDEDDGRGKDDDEPTWDADFERGRKGEIHRHVGGADGVGGDVPLVKWLYCCM
jgi:hypothetical protein